MALSTIEKNRYRGDSNKSKEGSTILHSFTNRTRLWFHLKYYIINPFYKKYLNGTTFALQNKLFSKFIIYRRGPLKQIDYIPCLKVCKTVNKI
jgi:hypothetical protein